MRKTVVIQNSGDVARKLCREIVAALSPGLFSRDELFGIQLAVEEAIINAVEHGNQGDPLKHVTVDYSMTSDRFEISITDEGCGFRPDEVPDPSMDENLDKVTGRGLALMKVYMDSVQYNTVGNRVSMVKRPAKAQGPA
jgi:serine/threonine-protein kinase RsbW